MCTLCFFALAAAGRAQEIESLSKEQRIKLLRPAYEAVRGNDNLRALDLRAFANLQDREAVDAFLRKMPLSPYEYLQIDMEVRHYEIVVPRFMQDLHLRWMELHEPFARQLYGDEVVNQALVRWPADYGHDITSIEAEATVGTNRNTASTASPGPVEYDGEIQIAVNHRNTNQMVASANTWGSSATCNNDSTLSIVYSSNGGSTWSYTCAPSNNVMALGTCSGSVFGSDPALYWNDNNEVFLNYMLLCATATTTRYSMVVARSADGGATWSKQGVIKNSWATTDLEDKNFYAIDNTAASPFFGRHYTCWDRNNNEKFAYSSNNGVTWTEVDLPTAPVGGIDLACEIAVQKNGNVHVVFDSLACGASTCTDERMWYTKSTNGGVSWSAPVQVRDFNLVGFSGANTPPVADERGINPFGAIDVDNSGGACDGTLYATFSDWTSGGATETDVWVSRSTNGGTTWSAAVKVNDDGLANRTQFHPFLQVDQSNGNVVVVWHDARNDANNRRVDYYVSRSTNCGVSFEANTKISQNSAEFNNNAITYTALNATDNANRNPNQFGEYMGLDVKNNKAYMAWTDSRHFYPGSSTNNQKENIGFAVVDFGAACTPPAPPTGVTATAAGQTQINVSWTASAGATSYNVLRSTTSGGPYTQVGTSASPSFSDTTVSCNTAYHYVVQAVGACASGNSAQASATTSACSGNQVLTFSSSPATAIPDNNTTGVTSTINVPNSMTITSVSVNVGITHTYQGDLEVALIGPDNTTVLLHNRTGAGADNINTTYNITTRSAQALTAFNGKNTSGAWKLRVRDLASADTGTLNSWKVTFNGYYTLTANTAIPDNNATGITSTINVPATGNVVSLRVRVDINHTYQGDLEVALIGPDNTTVLLHNRTGGTTDNIKTVYADLTAPAQALSAFNGKAINGAWKLRVRDLASADTGTLNFWEIDF
ncbi:MAG TPA: proprotein convertase P-domain-containing protein, partial [Thermoanaerobaculia bacterium]|nr:proprotein convertase P-domain-containing protein [Thermoanaerobaculia bacterium]